MGHHESSVVIKGSSVVIRGHPWSSGVIRGHQGSSVVIRGHQLSSGVISGHQRSSGVIRGPRRAPEHHMRHVRVSDHAHVLDLPVADRS
jgi:hypothetical protein